MKHQLWNFCAVVGAIFMGFLAIVLANTVINKITQSPNPRVDDQRILDHLRVGAFFTDGEHYGDNHDGLPGRLEFPTLYLSIHINEDKSVRLKQDGHGWEPVTGQLREAVLFAYNQKVWG